MSVRTHAERLELAITERRVTWHRRGEGRRHVQIHFPRQGSPGRQLAAHSRPLTAAEYKVLHLMPVRFMRRRDDAPGVSRGIVLMAE